MLAGDQGRDLYSFIGNANILLKDAVKDCAEDPWCESFAYCNYGKSYWPKTKVYDGYRPLESNTAIHNDCKTYVKVLPGTGLLPRNSDDRVLL